MSDSSSGSHSSKRTVEIKSPPVTNAFGTALGAGAGWATGAALAGCLVPILILLATFLLCAIASHAGAH